MTPTPELQGDSMGHHYMLGDVQVHLGCKPTLMWDPGTGWLFCNPLARDPRSLRCALQPSMEAKPLSASCLEHAKSCSGYVDRCAKHTFCLIFHWLGVAPGRASLRQDRSRRSTKTPSFPDLPGIALNSPDRLLMLKAPPFIHCPGTPAYMAPEVWTGTLTPKAGPREVPDTTCFS